MLKNSILGSSYDLSLVFIGDTRSRTLNRTYRKKDKPTNVLSFPLDKNAGEILINLRQVERETSKYGLNVKNLTGYLLIHGLLHLKGLEHGSTMDRAEQRFCTQFDIPYPLE